MSEIIKVSIAGSTINILPDSRHLGSTHKAAHALIGIDKVVRSIQSYLEDAKFVYVKGGDGVWRAELAPGIPRSISLEIGDVLHNLRSSLDILVGELIQVHGGAGKRSRLPFAKTAENLEQEIRKVVPDVGGVRKFLRSLSTYSGGNYRLNALHELNIIDKHRRIIPVGASMSVDVDYSNLVADASVLWAERFGIPANEGRRVVHVGPIKRTIIKEGPIDFAIKQFDPARHFPPTDRIWLLFPEDVPLSGRPIWEGLMDLFGEVGDVIDRASSEL